MLGKAIKHVIKQEKARKKLCKGKGVDRSEKTTSTPLNLKCKVWNQGEKD